EVALLRAREPVELHGVLADVEVRLDGHVRTAVPKHRRRRVHEVTDAVHVDDQPGGRELRPATQARDHRTTCRSGEVSAWQIATASASAAWFGEGSSGSPSMAFTMR